MKGPYIKVFRLPSYINQESCSEAFDRMEAIIKAKITTNNQS